MTTISQPPRPQGELTLQTIAMPKDVNANGDIFGGWLVSQMDIAGGIISSRRAQGRCATVAINSMTFLRPVPVGSVISCYCEIREVGRSSIKIAIEVWISHEKHPEPVKVTEGEFIFVAIDKEGNTRSVD